MSSQQVQDLNGWMEHQGIPNVHLTNIKLDDTWRGANESFLMHYNDQLRLLDSLVDSDEKLPDNTRVTFLESPVESVPDLRCVKIMSSKHSLTQQDPSHTGPILTC